MNFVHIFKFICYNKSQILIKLVHISGILSNIEVSYINKIIYINH